MDSARSVILLGINPISDYKGGEISALLSQLEYTDKEGIGFKNISLENDDIIVGEALKKVPVFLNVLNLDTQQIEKKEEFILSEIDFTVDLANNILEVYSNQQELRKLLIVFRTLVKDFLTITQLSFSISSTLFAFKNLVNSVEVKKMLIKDFQHEDGVIGNYDARFYNTDVAWDFLEKHKDQVICTSFFAVSEEWEGIVTLDIAGKLKLNSKSKHSMTRLLDLLKPIISKNN